MSRTGSTPGGRRPAPRVVAVLGGVLGLALLGGGVWSQAQRAGDPPGAGVAPPGTVSAPARTAPSATPTPTPGDVPAAPVERIQVPAVGIDLTVLPIDPVGGVIDPPTIEEAYWIDDYGVPATEADNTVYVVAHSSLRDAAAFNPLLDVAHQESVLRAGDEVLLTTTAGTLRYEVVGSTRYGKKQLPAADEIWAIEPGVLHLITCFQEDGLARAEDNLVVTARLVDGVPHA